MFYSHLFNLNYENQNYCCRLFLFAYHVMQTDSKYL